MQKLKTQYNPIKCPIKTFFFCCLTEQKLRGFVKHMDYYLPNGELNLQVETVATMDMK